MRMAVDLASSATSTAHSVTILVHSMNMGGAQKRVMSLANGFAASGRAVDLVALSGEGDAGRMLGPEVRQVVLRRGMAGLPRSMRGLGPLRAYLEERKPDVLLVGANRTHVVAALACATVARPPLLILRFARHPRRHLPWSRPWKRLRDYLRRPLERWALRRAARIIAVSQESAAAIRRLVRDRARVIFIPNPTIGAAFRQSLRRHAELPWFDASGAGGDPMILGIGRLCPAKDFATLVEAVAIVNRTRPARLLLLGEGRQRRAIEAIVARRGLGDRVELVGYVEEVGGWLARADLLVSSSLWEGSPGVIIEALEAGVPVVATACPGGSVELLEGSDCARLVPIRNPAAMAEAIVEMLGRPCDRAALRALAEPFQDDGRAERLYLEAIDAALADRS